MKSDLLDPDLDARRHGFAPVWIIEDNAFYRDTVRELLNGSERLRCTRAFPDCASALAVVEGGREQPALVLMDLALPGMNGIDGTREIRRRLPTVSVVVLTVHGSNDRIFDAICAGASGYLLKSATADEILHSLQKVLDGGAAMDALIARRVLDMFSSLVGPRADYRLSPRERQILQCLVDGLTKQQMAAQLFLSPHTIDRHVRSIYTKLHVHNRSGAVAKALREHLL
jgi:DNA-binding NarL/FixJ family response regulator